MKYEHTTKGLASLGRNGDDSLVHVSKAELESLENIVGHALTRNPETGLPEAFSISDILIPVGIGLASAFTGGAGSAALGLGTMGSTAIGAGTGALLGGGATAIQGKGFMPGMLGGAVTGGFGGYAGAGLGEAGTSAVTPSAETLAPISKENALMLGKSPTAAQLENAPGLGIDTKGIEGINTPPDFSTAAQNQASGMLSKKGLTSLGTMAIPAIGMGSAITGGMEQSQQAQKDREQAAADTQNYNQQQSDYFSSLGFTLPSQTTYASPNQQRQQVFDILGYASGGGVNMARSDIGPINAYYPPQVVEAFEQSNIGQDIPKFALGGSLSSAQPEPAGGLYPQALIPQAAPAPAATPAGIWAAQQRGGGFAEGGQVDYYEHGGLLDGPGYGMSDDINASIDGKEPIRVADGEFVIPPNIISIVGDGDPDKGAELFDQMLKSIRHAAHGKTEQIKQDAGKVAAEKMVARALKKKSKK